MTSASIYTPITPTYLYIKQHSVTGLKYFGKTTADPYKYTGSGTYWKSHIKKYDKKHIVTLWVSEIYTDTSISEFALQFSVNNNIVESSEWANLIPENGLDGWLSGKPHSAETKIKQSNANKGKPAHNKGKPSHNKGKSMSEEQKIKISISNTGKTFPKITCPHCGKVGGTKAMKQWHFDHCKHKN
jgi:hypothetical protein